MGALEKHSGSLPEEGVDEIKEVRKLWNQLAAERSEVLLDDITKYYADRIKHIEGHSNRVFVEEHRQELNALKSQKAFFEQLVPKLSERAIFMLAHLLSIEEVYRNMEVILSKFYDSWDSKQEGGSVNAMLQIPKGGPINEEHTLWMRITQEAGPSSEQIIQFITEVAQGPARVWHDMTKRVPTSPIYNPNNADFSSVKRRSAYNVLMCTRDTGFDADTVIGFLDWARSKMKNPETVAFLGKMRSGILNQMENILSELIASGVRHMHPQPKNFTVEFIRTDYLHAKAKEFAPGEHPLPLFAHGIPNPALVNQIPYKVGEISHSVTEYLDDPEAWTPVVRIIDNEYANYTRRGTEAQIRRNGYYFEGLYQSESAHLKAMIEVKKRADQIRTRSPVVDRLRLWAGIPRKEGVYVQEEEK